jgi:hypothetical protein
VDEKGPNQQPEKTVSDKASTQDDKWCLSFLSVQYVPDILAAIDEDASGFVRTTEANTFTTSKPQEWSLAQWLAFWAQGMSDPDFKL